MKTISRQYEQKQGHKWVATYRTEDELEVYRNFSMELMYSKVFKSPVYKRMVQYSNYDGTRTVIFYQETGRSVYIVKS